MIKYLTLNYYWVMCFLTAMTMFLNSCVEELDLEVTGQNELPNILIVEAVITDEFKFQEVRLSKMDSLLDLRVERAFNQFAPGSSQNEGDVDLVRYEENASVSISVSDGNQIIFVEGAPGTYISGQPFQVEEGLEYELRIKTADNREFVSKPMKIEGKSSIENVYAEKVTLSDGGKGIEIFVDSSPINGDAGNLRFRFDETYKIIAPNWSPFQYILTDYDPCAIPVVYDLDLVRRTEEARVCYTTVTSNNVILNNKDVNADGRLEQFSIHALGQNNFKISHRYSILVNQLVTSAESYGFYEKLKNFSENGNVFSQVQPGFLEGNISSTDGRQGTVIGFFDVASVSQKRLFFDYDDFFPDAELPDYPINCTLQSTPESHVSYCFQGLISNPCPQSVIERVFLDNITYVGANDNNIGTCPGPHVFVSKPCGDCRLLGSNEVPEFWIEE